MTAPTIGLALTAKDEEDNLPFLLGSVRGAFDQVVLVDTGSTDRTVEVFEEWAKRQDDLALGYRVERFEWCDDFAAARNYADSLLDTDWLFWADADDVIRNAHRLRGLAQSARPEIGAFAISCAYDTRPDGRTDRFDRVRLTRAGASEWYGRVHELKTWYGGLVGVLPSICEVIHRCDEQSRAASQDRNERILSKWLAEEPDNPRVQELASINRDRKALVG